VSDEISDLDGMLGFLAEEGSQRRDPEEHPDPETLTAYQANELSEEEDGRIQDHLAVCRHCTELLLDLEEFLQPRTSRRRRTGGGCGRA
jgi:Putative zinc-finger